MLLGIVVSGGAFFVLLFASLEFLFLVPAYIHARTKGVRFSTHLLSYFPASPTRRKTVLSLVASLAIPLVMLVVGRILMILGAWIIGLFGEGILVDAIDGLNQVTVTTREPIDFVLYLVTCFLVIAPCEEIFFRGFMITVLPVTKTVSALVSSVAFAIFHVVTTFNPFSVLLVFPYYFAWGIVLAFLYHATGKNLLFPVLAHGTYNFLLYLL